MSLKLECNDPCGICGELHQYCDCTTINIKKHIPDKKYPSKAHASLPDIVRIETMADGSFAIVANTFIEKGTEFGPLEAQKLLTLDPGINFPVKFFTSAEDDFSEYYLNTGDEHHCNWLMFVTPAQNIEEQNLICFQHKSKIMYACLKDVKAGEYLKVWYSPYYAKRMQKELLNSRDVPVMHNLKDDSVLEAIDLNKLLKKQQKLTDRDNWTCKFCGKLEKDIPRFANHIIQHYSKKETKRCEECDQTFTTKKHLQTHMRKVHNKTVIIEISKNTPDDFGKSREVIVGGPLLNDLLTDSLDNTNLVLPNIELNLNAMETDALNLAVDNLLTENVKELDHFNFDIAESQEQFVCDICLKVFAKLRYLLQHLKKHTGRFTCGYCLKIFCRKENLNAHKCENDRKHTHQCTICAKKFLLKRYLSRHMYTVHERKYACEKCNKLNNTLKEFKEHNCSALPNDKKEVFPCTTCGREFFHMRYLKKHMDTHRQRKEKSTLQNFICEVCGLRCKSHTGLYLHRKTHSERSLECHVCHKKFYRNDVLREHALQHTDAKISCNLCNKTFKTDRFLSRHMRQHTALKRYKCDKCPRIFSQMANLNTHVLKVHLKRCNVCNKEFNTTQLLEMHKKGHTLKEFYVCPLCSKCVKLKSSLTRHIRQYHPDQDVASIISNLKPATANLANLIEEETKEEKEKDNSSAILEQLGTNSALSQLTCLQDSISDDSNFDSIVDNFENIINSYHINNTDDLPLPTYTDSKPNNEKRMLDFTDLQMDIDSNFDVNVMGINTQEVCLSMPDLTDTDQEIMLGDNAFILDNGTIVEPKDQGNVLVYVLDKNL